MYICNVDHVLIASQNVSQNLLETFVATFTIMIYKKRYSIYLLKTKRKADMHI